MAIRQLLGQVGMPEFFVVLGYAGLPNERSILKDRPLQDIYDEIRDVYKRYPQPWVIGYSGSKDSTTVLQLVWKPLKKNK